ncbi:hypothetical protein VE00_08803 [Pseudogymnoascus sp. WSF 3629]|nr:hypothetical protein VE00_08803 [Pseudogymnoascus sp. WSF 3629]
MATFWTNVADELSELTGKPPHASLSRTVSRMIANRQHELEVEESGTQEGRGEFEIAIDEWIEIVAAQKKREKERKATQTRIDGESAK